MRQDLRSQLAAMATDPEVAFLTAHRWTDVVAGVGSVATVSLIPALHERRLGALHALGAALHGERSRRLLDIACTRQHRAGEVWATPAGPVYVARLRATGWGYNEAGEIDHIAHEPLLYVDTLEEPTSWLERAGKLPAWCRCPNLEELHPGIVRQVVSARRKRRIVAEHLR